MTNDCKCVLSVRVAKHLIANGYTIVDIEPSHKFKDKLVFVFENSPELEKELTRFHK